MIVTCPYCRAVSGQVKAGFNASGSQRHLCRACRRKYTPEPRPRGHPTDVRLHAILLYSRGAPLRQIAALVGVSRQSILNWIRMEQEGALDDDRTD
jgi:transposase-like protein